VAAEPSVQPAPGHARFPLVDGLRAVAALLVVIYHVGLAAGVNEGSWAGAATSRLAIGVALFFLISGFVIYRPFVAARAGREPAVPLLAFARRRALRIVPAYWVALTVTALVASAWAFYPTAEAPLGDRFWVYYGFLQVYDDTTSVLGLGVAWSLCIEVSFYALLPLYAWIVGRGRAAPRTELVLLAVLGLLSAALRGWVYGDPSRYTDLFHLNATLPTTFAWFAAGMALAIASVHGAAGAGRALAWAGRHLAACWTAALMLFGVLSLAGLPRHSERYSVAGYLLEHIGYALVSLLILAPAVSAGRANLGRRTLALAPVAWTGAVSYGIYLWHLPALLAIREAGVFAGTPFAGTLTATLAVTLVLAAASYYAVERPLLAFKHPAARKLSRRGTRLRDDRAGDPAVDRLAVDVLRGDGPA
jgi:peptidoglycan/LPS O-acetylase OafA/YrhL